jgi:hypothetical protein
MRVEMGANIMSQTTESALISIPGELYKEIEAARGSIGLERFIYRAIRSYICAIRRRENLEKIAQECAESGEYYDELSPDLADEVWQCLEQEALNQTNFSEN